GRKGQSSERTCWRSLRRCRKPGGGPEVTQLSHPGGWFATFCRETRGTDLKGTPNLWVLRQFVVKPARGGHEAYQLGAVSFFPTQPFAGRVRAYGRPIFYAASGCSRQAVQVAHPFLGCFSLSGGDQQTVGIAFWRL